MTTTLLIACHGDTFASDTVHMRIGARTDIPLVEIGVEQAETLSAHLLANGLAPELIGTSELQRAVQTAQIVQKIVGNHAPIEKMPAFNDIDYGPDNNQPEEKTRDRIGDAALKAWDDEGIPPLGWEVDSIDLRASWHDFGTRVAKDFGGQTVLVVTHDTVARFASILCGDSKALHVNGNVHLKAGHYGHLVYVGPHWQCVGWNIAPEAGAAAMPLGKDSVDKDDGGMVAA